MDYEEPLKWDDHQSDAMEDESLMEDDSDSLEQFPDDRRSSNNEFFRGLSKPSRQEKSNWNDSMDDKGEFYNKTAEKNIVHKDFFNKFDDDFDDQDLK